MYYNVGFGLKVNALTSCCREPMLHDHIFKGGEKVSGWFWGLSSWSLNVLHMSLWVSSRFSSWAWLTPDWVDVCPEMDWVALQGDPNTHFHISHPWRWWWQTAIKIGSHFSGFNWWTALNFKRNNTAVNLMWITTRSSELSMSTNDLLVFYESLLMCSQAP